MKRAQQMRRDLITVAVVAVLLGAAMLLNSNAAFAQSATEDQYSSATSASASPSAAASTSPTSDQYSNASGSTASPTTPATATPTASASPTATAPAPVNTEDPSFTQAKVGALQSALQTIAQATSSALPADAGASIFGGGSFLGLPHWALQTLGGPGWAVINMAQHGPPDPLVRDDPEYLNSDGRENDV
jgi:cytoskeletal protein RodZ